MKEFFDRLLHRLLGLGGLYAQTIHIPNEGKWLLLIQGEVEFYNIREFLNRLVELRPEDDGVFVWYFGNKAKRVKLIRIGK